MTWLLALLVPGLLMAAAFSLERIEAGLRAQAGARSREIAARDHDGGRWRTRQVDRVQRQFAG